MLQVLVQVLRDYRSRITRSSAIQQGLLDISIFLFSLFLLSIITYFMVQHALETRLDNSLQQRMDVLLEQVKDHEGEAGNTDLLQKQHLLSQHQPFYLLLHEGELQKAENKAFRQPGFSTQPLGHDRYDDDDDDQLYRILVMRQAGGVLVVGENIDDDQEVLEIVLSAFVLNGLIALVLTTVLVIYLARRAQRQIHSIEKVLQHAAQGELTQRIGFSGRQNDLAHVGAQIDLMLSRLETSMIAMKDISANIAHELKTPITRLRHDLVGALEKREAGQDNSELLNSAYDEAERITDTFDALLRIAQIEGGSRRSNFALLDLKDIVDTIAEIYTGVAEDAGMKLLWLPGEHIGRPLRISGDRELLVQMLANLVENAIRYCPPGTHIVLTLQQTINKARGRKVELTVADNGPGIPYEERQQVFRRLYRLNESRSDQQGSGLGLSLVKAIVELHDASINLTDNKPGLRVVMHFPEQSPD